MAGRTALVVSVALLLGSCADDVDAGGGDPTTTTAPTPTFVGDGSAFCDAMLAVGQVERSAEATPAEVLAENDVLQAHLDEAQANTPADAPADFDALLDDYRAASLAIAAAQGDVEAAFAALERDDPDLVARLGSSTSHAEGYQFLVDRCGIAAP